MRPLTSPRVILAIAVACVLLPTVAAGARLPFGATSSTLATVNSATFEDSSGEDPLAPDITTMTVSNSDAGMITFRINVPNRPAVSQDMLIDVFVDTDSNPATGSQDIPGIDYVMELARGEINLFRWDGTNFTRRFGDPSAVTLTFSYSGGVTIRISAAELGNTKRFNFLVNVTSGVAIDPVTGNFDFTNARDDFAPDLGKGFYSFEVKITPPSLVVRKFVTTPAKPVAGRIFTMRLTAARSDTGAVLQSGRVTCVGRVGGTPLRAVTRRVVSGAAVCSFRIPKAAKGKTFRGSVTVVFEGLRATRSFSGKIG